MINDKELEILNALLDKAMILSKEGITADPENHEVAVKDLKIFNDDVLESKVFDDLAIKGLIECSGNEDENGNELLEYVSITPEGLKAIKSIKGVH